MALRAACSGQQITDCTHASDSHTHRAGASKLERGSNHGAYPAHFGLTMCPLLPPGGMYNDTGSLRGIRQNGGMSTPNDTGLSLEIHCLHRANDELQRRADKPQNETATSRKGSQRRPVPGRRQTTKSVGGWINRPRAGREKDVKVGLTPKKRCTAEEDVWPDDGQLQHAPPRQMGRYHARSRPQGVGIKERAMRPKLG